MSSRSTVRLPISIPEWLQNKPYTVKVSFHPLLPDGSISDDMGIFREDALRSEDFEGSSSDAKTLVFNRTEIPKFSDKKKMVREYWSKGVPVDWEQDCSSIGTLSYLK